MDGSIGCCKTCSVHALAYKRTLHLRFVFRRSRTSRSDSLHTHARTKLRRRKTVKLTAYSVDTGKTASTLCRTIVQVQLSTINVYPLNTLTFHPLQHPGFPSSAFPWPGQSSPTLSRSLSLTQSNSYPDYSTILPHSHPVSLI